MFKSSSSSSSNNIDNVHGQVINVDLDADDEMPPPPARTQQKVSTSSTNNNNKPALKRSLPQQQQSRKVPINVSLKRMLPYVESKPGAAAVNDKKKMTTNKCPMFMGYKLHYLAKPLTMIFKHKVKLFQCSSLGADMRLGVGNIDEDDKMSMIKHLNDVAGSLPTTCDTVRRPIDDQCDVFFISLKANRATVFNSKGDIMKDLSKMPEVCTAKLAVQFLGMKTRLDEATFMYTVAQILIKRDRWEEQAQANTKLLFNLSSSSCDDDDDNETMMAE